MFQNGEFGMGAPISNVFLFAWNRGVGFVPHAVLPQQVMQGSSMKDKMKILNLWGCRQEKMGCRKQQPFFILKSRRPCHKGHPK